MQCKSNALDRKFFWMKEGVSIPLQHPSCRRRHEGCLWTLFFPRKIKTSTCSLIRWCKDNLPFWDIWDERWVGVEVNFFLVVSLLYNSTHRLVYLLDMNHSLHMYTPALLLGLSSALHINKVPFTLTYGYVRPLRPALILHMSHRFFLGSLFSGSSVPLNNPDFKHIIDFCRKSNPIHILILSIFYFT